MSTGLRFTLEVDGLPPDAFAVVSFHLTQSLSSLFSLDLSLVSQQFLSLGICAGAGQNGLPDGMAGR
ncbi:ybl66 [Escherichia coli]|nr:ybl66 [Escherichia coli]